MSKTGTTAATENTTHAGYRVEILREEEMRGITWRTVIVEGPRGGRYSVTAAQASNGNWGCGTVQSLGAGRRAGAEQGSRIASIVRKALN